MAGLVALARFGVARFNVARFNVRDRRKLMLGFE
jgi:hypothetical protein